VDKRPDALALTGAWGADHTVIADGKQVDRVLELTDGRGAEVVRAPRAT
jgi:NAD+-dependent secondary alcohol dehydrogenase Adh1